MPPKRIPKKYPTRRANVNKKKRGEESSRDRVGYVDEKARRVGAGVKAYHKACEKAMKKPKEDKPKEEKKKKIIKKKKAEKKMTTADLRSKYAGRFAKKSVEELDKMGEEFTRDLEEARKNEANSQADLRSLARQVRQKIVKAKK